jgi:hypothetical protein
MLLLDSAAKYSIYEWDMSPRTGSLQWNQTFETALMDSGWFPAPAEKPL